jgi:hypothetical protein
VFQGPLKVDIVLDRDHPFEAAKDGAGTWLVHEGEFKQGCDVGMVSDGHGFEDSPDCERISGGLNSKGPRAVAIGRQANLLSWGFYGAPDRMTESAKRVFLNTIVYMKRFDGHVPLVRKMSVGRSWLEQYIEALGGMTEEQLADDSERSYAAYLKKQFPAELVRDRVDPAKLRQWYDQNVEFLGPGDERRSFAVDQDLVAWGVGNRQAGFLDRLLEAFAADPHDARALRLAERYLGKEHGKDAAAARRFIEAERPWLFFSDTGGYRWFVDVNAKRGAAAAPTPRR